MTTPEGYPPPTWIIIPDHRVGIRCWYDRDYAMNFRVFDMVKTCGPEDSEEGTWVFMQNGDINPLREWANFPWEIEGSVKWDGCADWQTNPDCMFHNCGPKVIEWLGTVFTVVYAMAKRNMDLLDDEVPPFPEGYIEIIELKE